MPLTRYKNKITVLTETVANSLFGGLFGTPKGNLLDPEDPLVAGHVHDGQHIDGHAQKIHLDDHITGQLNGANIMDVSIPASKIIGVVGGAGTLEDTLVLGNETAGTDIIISTGDQIIGETDLTLSSPASSNLYLDSGGFIQSDALSSFSVNAGSNIELTSIGFTQIDSATSVSIDSGTSISSTSTGQTQIDAGGDLILNSDIDVEISSIGATIIDSGSNTIVDAAGFIELDAVGDINLNTDGDVQVNDFFSIRTTEQPFPASSTVDIFCENPNTAPGSSATILNISSANGTAAGGGSPGTPGGATFIRSGIGGAPGTSIGETPAPGGSIQILTGRGGNADTTAGNGSFGGTINITAGTGGAAASGRDGGNGGSIGIVSGTGGLGVMGGAAGSGSDITLLAGDSGPDLGNLGIGDGGNIFLLGGIGNALGGNININPGPGGLIPGSSFVRGAAGSGSAPSAGSANLLGGDAFGVTTAPGNAIVNAGRNSDLNVSGQVRLGISTTSRVVVGASSGIQPASALEIYPPQLLVAQPATPSTDATRGKLYSKLESGIIELFYLDSAGTEYQITPPPAPSSSIAYVIRSESIGVTTNAILAPSQVITNANSASFSQMIYFKGKIVAHAWSGSPPAADDTACWTIEGCVVRERSTGDVLLPNPPLITPLYNPNGFDWDVDITVDNASKELDFLATVDGFGSGPGTAPDASFYAEIEFTSAAAL